MNFARRPITAIPPTSRLKVSADNCLSYSSPCFSIFALPSLKGLNIAMQMEVPIFSTTAVPQTLSLLKNYFPAVLNTQCFNDEDLPFHREVISTEIGHLFEHILLECLCQAKLSTGRKQAVFNGLTSWDWYKNRRGSFTIEIDAKKSDLPYLQTCLTHTIGLTEFIISSSANHKLPTQILHS